MSCEVGDEKAEVTIFEGKVVAANESGTVNITDGQSVVAEKGKAPSYQTVVKPRDAVQWALYYPPVIDRKAGEAQGRHNRSLARPLMPSPWVVWMKRKPISTRH